MIAAAYETAEKHVTNEYGLFKQAWATYYKQERWNVYISQPRTSKYYGHRAFLNKHN
jgi:hypothetical protein